MWKDEDGLAKILIGLRETRSAGRFIMRVYRERRTLHAEINVFARTRAAARDGSPRLNATVSAFRGIRARHDIQRDCSKIARAFTVPSQ